MCNPTNTYPRLWHPGTPTTHPPPHPRLSPAVSPAPRPANLAWAEKGRGPTARSNPLRENNRAAILRRGGIGQGGPAAGGARSWPCHVTVNYRLLFSFRVVPWRLLGSIRLPSASVVRRFLVPGVSVITRTPGVIVAPAFAGYKSSARSEQDYAETSVLLL